MTSGNRVRNPSPAVVPCETRVRTAVVHLGNPR